MSARPPPPNTDLLPSSSFETSTSRIILAFRGCTLLSLHYASILLYIPLARQPQTNTTMAPVTVSAGAPQTPLTGSALIKSLKAAQDPPVAGGPSKVDIATTAWSDADLVVPRKADVIRDWVLEAWGRAKPG